MASFFVEVEIFMHCQGKMVEDNNSLSWNFPRYAFVTYLAEQDPLVADIWVTTGLSSITST